MMPRDPRDGWSGKWNAKNIRRATAGRRPEMQHTGKSDLVDIAAEVRGETDKAWRLFDGDRLEWVPKSQVEDNGDGTFAMPEWLATEKGFI
jgi:hypothetical protein